ncbi:13644_t:CDS:1 [Racocetra fulgida]|uniref:13644_t:CDS:1 n=1 Tax=Racocetra fulgida TaxID=60492 RepID=A0A9N9C813_9GLOM|nr:13644_t:CDS:1 [Racocetra fulgida]
MPTNQYYYDPYNINGTPREETGFSYSVIQLQKQKHHICYNCRQQEHYAAKCHSVYILKVNQNSSSDSSEQSSTSSEDQDLLSDDSSDICDSNDKKLEDLEEDTVTSTFDESMSSEAETDSSQY